MAQFSDGLKDAWREKLRRPLQKDEGEPIVFFCGPFTGEPLNPLKTAHESENNHLLHAVLKNVGQIL